MKMKTRSILLVLGLAMIQDQISSKHYLVESKGKQYLVETEGRTQVGRGGGGELPLGEKLPDGIEVEDHEGFTWNLTGAIELHRLVLKNDYDQLKKRKDEITNRIIDSKCSADVGHRLKKMRKKNLEEVTPLFVACNVGNPKVGADKAALLLLSKGADPNKAAKQTRQGVTRQVTPLSQAVWRGSTEVVRSLLASGAKQDLDTGFSPLEIAKGKENDEIVDLLEPQSGEKKRPLGEKLPYRWSGQDETLGLTGAIELHRLALEDSYQLKKRKKEITRTIIDSTCALDDFDNYERYKEATPLFLACYVGNSEAALLLLSKGADPNKAVKDVDGDVTTPLYEAVWHNSTEVVRSLLERKARQDLDTGESPLEAAKDYGNDEIVKLLEAAQSG